MVESLITVQKEFASQIDDLIHLVIRGGGALMKGGPDEARKSLIKGKEEVGETHIRVLFERGKKCLDIKSDNGEEPTSFLKKLMGKNSTFKLESDLTLNF